MKHKTKSWSGVTPDGMQIVICLRAMKALAKIARNAGSLMSAGILTGRYTNNRTCIVTEVHRPPRDTIRKQHEVIRGIAGLKTLCASRWKSQIQTFYVGDWHYSLFDDGLQPCEIDIETLKQIDEKDCKTPILVSIGPTTMRVHMWRDELMEFSRHSK